MPGPAREGHFAQILDNPEAAAAGCKSSQASSEPGVEVYVGGRLVGVGEGGAAARVHAPGDVLLQLGAHLPAAGAGRAGAEHVRAVSRRLTRPRHLQQRAAGATTNSTGMLRA